MATLSIPIARRWELATRTRHKPAWTTGPITQTASVDPWTEVDDEATWCLLFAPWPPSWSWPRGSRALTYWTGSGHIDTFEAGVYIPQPHQPASSRRQRDEARWTRVHPAGPGCQLPNTKVRPRRKGPLPF